jgi:hypothetical protein
MSFERVFDNVVQIGCLVVVDPDFFSVYIFSTPLVSYFEAVCEFYVRVAGVQRREVTWDVDIGPGLEGLVSVVGPQK